jgi:hypothetical protein
MFSLETGTAVITFTPSGVETLPSLREESMISRTWGPTPAEGKTCERDAADIKKKVRNTRLIMEIPLVDCPN